MVAFNLRYLVALAAAFAGFQVSPAAAITAELAKKCDAAAFKAFPSQQVGTKIGIADRTKFRQECIARNGDLSSMPKPSGGPPAASPPAN